jgi:DNA repair protein SbcC/Rad50
MEILSVSLKNFKSHSDRHFDFQPGTNAICGENGAGKTSILEAIAWTLFNHRGAYRNDDLIRNGASSAQVRVAFVSSRDQRTYEISRCTRAGYTLYDPQLGEKLDYSRIDEEVMPWLRQHLGVAPGTDLGKLFANTVGVPQGTFAADFLLPTEKRKPIFDAVLKVEEYRQANQQLLSLEKYAKVEVERLERDIAQYDETLAEREELVPRHDQLQADIHRIQTELQQWQTQIDSLQAERDRLGAQASQLQTLATAIDQLTPRIQAQQQLLERSQAELADAEAAAQQCLAHRDAYQAVTQANDTLKTLEQSRRTQQTLMQQRQRQSDQLSTQQAQLAALNQQLATLTTVQAELDTLPPLVEQQQQIEQKQTRVTQQLQQCQQVRQTLATLRTQSQSLGDRQTQLSQAITETQALHTVVAQIPELEQQQQRLQQQISRVTAAAQFEAELRTLMEQAQTQGDRHHGQVLHAAQTLEELRPLLPAAALDQLMAALQSGDQLHRDWIAELHGMLVDLQEQASASKLEQQLQTVNALLTTARQQQTQLFQLESLVAEQTRLTQQETELQLAIAEAEAQVASEDSLEAHRQGLVASLALLDNPRGRQQLLQRQVQQQANLTQQQQTRQAEVTQQTAAIAQLDAQLAEFLTLSDQIETQQQLRETHQPGYQIYLEHQQLANLRRTRREQVQATETQLTELTQALAPLTAQHADLSQTYDPAQAETIQTAYQDASNKQNYLSGSLPEMVKRLADVARQLEKLNAVETKRSAAQADLKHRTKADRFIRFARKAYKEAGPRITERYVHSISRESDRIFRELLNRPNVGLEWTREYEIIVQEGAHARRMVNLSGGEQMCAALAVRLALLRVLADIDIAFFDEPTTNMDRPRREHLAEAIANIKTFRQLFVISHDDTFEKVTENIILVERE